MNQAVTRNMRRFPDDFMFELTRMEIRNISQIVTCSETIKHAKNVRVFTEQGVAMLSTVLNSERAIDVNIAIMRTFVKLRQMLDSHAQLAKKLAELEAKYDGQFRIVFDALNELMVAPEPRRKQIGFNVNEPGTGYKAKRAATNKGHQKSRSTACTISSSRMI